VQGCVIIKLYRPNIVLPGIMEFNAQDFSGFFFKFSFVLQNFAILIGWGKANAVGQTSPDLKATDLAIYEYR
jgi:hypothetical protein